MQKRSETFSAVPTISHSQLATLLPSTDDEPWRLQAECANADDPRVFFPEGEQAPGVSYVQAKRIAKTYCDNCAVRTECFEYRQEAEIGDLTNGNNRPGKLIGIWGGWRYTKEMGTRGGSKL